MLMMVLTTTDAMMMMMVVVIADRRREPHVRISELFIHLLGPLSLMLTFTGLERRCSSLRTMTRESSCFLSCFTTSTAG